ncbi:MAG: hypothetical protein WBK28_03685 [Minisyncoccia bacterium]
MIGRFFPFVFILIAIGLFFGYVNPTYSGNVQALRTEIRGYDAALSAARQFDDKRQGLMEEQGKIPEDDIERIEAFLPDGVDNVQLIVDLNALAERTGVELSDFDVASPDAKEDEGIDVLESQEAYESLEISLTAVGTYGAFKVFLGGIERSLRPLDLVALSVEDSQTGVYTYTMTFRIYWLR